MMMMIPKKIHKPSMASSSLSSLSSTSSDDMIELKAREETKSCISYKNSKLSNVSSDNNTLRSQVSVVTNASAGPSSPIHSPPIQVMDREGYDSERISASISEKSEALDWSVTSSDSLFSLSIGHNSLARDDDISLARDHEVILGELLAYYPSHLIHLEDSKGKKSDTDEQRSKESEEKSSIPILWWRDLCEFDNSDQMPTGFQPFSSPVTEKRKKNNKTMTKKTCHCWCKWPTCCGGSSYFSCRSCCG